MSWKFHWEIYPKNPSFFEFTSSSFLRIKISHDSSIFFSHPISLWLFICLTLNFCAFPIKTRNSNSNTTHIALLDGYFFFSVLKVNSQITCMLCSYSRIYLQLWKFNSQMKSTKITWKKRRECKLFFDYTLLGFKRELFKLNPVICH